ncbi:MAG: glycosyltransferase family 39 protein, partial [Phycisphaerae bacterium]|nr:glycosyltransferase family 39 protein [Phycisphaerae bacterium]
MSRSILPLDSPAGSRPPGRARTAVDIALVLLLVGIVIAISADAPTHIYAYAQPWNIGAALGMLQSGQWLLPRNQMGVVPRKGQLYTWLLAGSIKLTASYDQFVFRLPSVAASFVMGVLVYFLAVRWVGRGAALLGAPLWVTMNHMHKLMYLATTDMLLALWITVGVLCADKLLFHPVASSKRARWAVLFWAAMILAALTKGWGVVNLSVLGGLIALATAVRPGFAALRRAGTTAAK